MEQYYAGNVVHLLDENKNPISENDMPILYQIVAVYESKGRAGLVTSYGEHIGLYPLEQLRLVSRNPLFRSSDYKIGNTVVWIDGEDVYEGTISKLYFSSALMVDVKKLMPVNYSIKIPYWKIPDGRNAYEELPSSDKNSSIGTISNKRRDY